MRAGRPIPESILSDAGHETLQPHRGETLTLSKDPLFIDKVRDIAGLYMDPPNRALVLCEDRKTHACRGPGSGLGCGGFEVS